MSTNKNHEGNTITTREVLQFQYFNGAKSYCTCMKAASERCMLMIQASLRQQPVLMLLLLLVGGG